jgi:hypothetical protein
MAGKVHGFSLLVRLDPYFSDIGQEIHHENPTVRFWHKSGFVKPACAERISGQCRFPPSPFVVPLSDTTGDRQCA